MGLIVDCVNYLLWSFAKFFLFISNCWRKYFRRQKTQIRNFILNRSSIFKILLYSAYFFVWFPRKFIAEFNCKMQRILPFVFHWWYQWQKCIISDPETYFNGQFENIVQFNLLHFIVVFFSIVRFLRSFTKPASL